MIIRTETGADRSASLEVERAAFGTPEEPDIVEAVRDLPGSFALVADLAGEVVGHVQMSTAWVGRDEVLALGPIAVLPSHQRTGIGTALVEAALEEAGRRDACAVILLGSPTYYGARGFVAGSTYGLANPFAGTLPDGFVIEEDDFQIASLDEARARSLTGVVRWHPVFG